MWATAGHVRIDGFLPAVTRPLWGIMVSGVQGTIRASPNSVNAAILLNQGSQEVSGHTPSELLTVTLPLPN